MNNLAPIVLFVYNRPLHTLRTLQALSQNQCADESTLYIFADGPKDFLPETIENITEVRRIIRQEKWCKEIIIVESEINRGLADSIVAGVSEVIAKHGKVITLEDDIVTSPGFIKYMNDALDIYSNNENVMHISGYMYPNSIVREDGIVFLRVLACWGWATWKRAWKYYSNDLAYFISELNSQSKIDQFNIRGNARFYEQLHANYTGSLYTWAVRWYASWYLKGGFAVFPTRSLVRNIGHDGSGVHCDTTNRYESILAQKIEIKDTLIKEDLEFTNWIDAFYQTENRERDQILKDQARTKFTFKKWVFKLTAKFINKLLNVHRTYYKDSLVPKSSTKMIRSYIADSAKIYQPYSISHSSIDEYSYVAAGSHLSLVTIGKFCSIGPNILAGYGVHPLDGISTSPMFYSSNRQNGITLSYLNKISERKPIRIGHDVFIGANVTIVDGVTIGDGAVIGAGAVVSKDIPPYAIAVGVPIKIVRYRFDEKTIERLLEMKWWNWSHKKLAEVERLFFDVNKFVSSSEGSAVQ